MTDEHEALVEYVAHAVDALTAAALATYESYEGAERYDFAQIACQVLTAVAESDRYDIEALLDAWSRAWDASLAEYAVQAVQALAAAAVLTCPTPSGQAEPYNFWQIVGQVLTTVAANLGGLEALLAGRPWSPEANHVRRMVQSTTAEDQLLAWRTEPVRLLLDPGRVLTELGLLDLLIEAVVSLQRHQDHLDRSQRAALDADIDALNAMWPADLAWYAAAYTDTARLAAAELGLTVKVEVEVVDDGRCEPDRDTLAARLHAAARAATPLPTSGLAPCDYQSGIDLTAGRTYLDRLAEQRGWL